MASIKYNKYAKPLKLKKIGLKGEKRTTQIFERLSDSYTVFSNLKINIDNNISNIDHVVIGPNGFFIIKTKNLNGKIIGTYDDKYLTQHKIGQKGGHYSKTFYNPIKQVNTHIYRLSSLLRSFNLNERIQGLVYFSNPDCKVSVSSNKSPVFSYYDDGINEVVKYITEYPQQSIPFEKQEAIIKLLSSCVDSTCNLENSYDVSENTNNDVEKNTNMDTLEDTIEDLPQIKMRN